MDDISEMKELRRNNKTGWLALSDDESLRFLIDALLDTAPKSLLDVDEISNRAGIDVDEAEVRLEFLSDLGVLEKVDEGYSMDEENSIVLENLFELNAAVNSQLSDVKKLDERLP